MDERAPLLATVLTEHGPMLARIAAGYEADPALREDLLQEIAVVLLRALPTFRGDSTLRTFVARIAHNRGVDHVVGRRRHQASEALEETLADPAADPLRHAERGRQIDALKAAVARLPLGQRQTVMLALEGFSQQETAQALGIEENAVAQRLSRARRQMQQWLTGAE